MSSHVLSHTIHFSEKYQAMDSADPVEEGSSTFLDFQRSFVVSLSSNLQDLRAVIRRLPGGRVALFAGGVKLGAPGPSWAQLGVGRC